MFTIPNKETKHKKSERPMKWSHFIYQALEQRTPDGGHDAKSMRKLYRVLDIIEPQHEHSQIRLETEDFNYMRKVMVKPGWMADREISEMLDVIEKAEEMTQAELEALESIKEVAEAAVDAAAGNGGIEKGDSEK